MTDQLPPFDLYSQKPVNWRLSERQLKYCRQKYEDGSLLALYDVMEYCEIAGIPLPQWALEGLRKFFAEAVLGGAKGKRGRGQSLIGAAQKWNKRQTRRLTVLCQRWS